MRTPGMELPVPFYGTEAYYDGIRHIAERNIGLQDQVADNANAAFKDTSPKGVILKPVAMQDEGDYIYQSLAAFCEPGRVSRVVILSRNAPLNADERAVEYTKSEMDRFTNTHPEVPLSYYDTRYSPQTTIGEIHQDLSGVGIGSLCNRYGFMIPRDVLLINADADTVATPSRYVDRLYEAAIAADYPELSFIYAGVRNANSGGRFPNMDAYMAWADLFAIYGEKYPDGHNAMGIGTYLAGNQYDARCAYGETTELLARARDIAGEHLNLQYIGPDAVTVSGRHAYHQMQAGETPHFDPVRSESTEYRSEVIDGADISFARAYNEIGMLCLAELPNVVAIQTEYAMQAGFGSTAAQLAAIEETRGIMGVEMQQMGAPYQLLGAVEGQLDRMRDRAMQKVA